jgi:hypothetical protein
VKIGHTRLHQHAGLALGLHEGGNHSGHTCDPNIKKAKMQYCDKDIDLFGSVSRDRVGPPDGALESLQKAILILWQVSADGILEQSMLRNLLDSSDNNRFLDGPAEPSQPDCSRRYSGGHIKRLPSQAINELTTFNM